MSSLTTIWRRRMGDPSRRAGSLRRTRSVRDGRPFTPLIDAKAAGALLDVPYTWLLAQARAGRVPHHRLGHYVRFDPADLREWLKDTRIGPAPLDHRAGHLGVMPWHLSAGGARGAAGISSSQACESD